MLYNLAEDLSEQNDLASKKPELAQELLDEWKAWNAELIDPKWGRQTDATLPWLESVGGQDPTTRPNFQVDTSWRPAEFR